MKKLWVLLIIPLLCFGWMDFIGLFTSNFNNNAEQFWLLSPYIDDKTININTFRTYDLDVNTSVFILNRLIEADTESQFLLEDLEFIVTQRPQIVGEIREDTLNVLVEFLIKFDKIKIRSSDRYDLTQEEVLEKDMLEGMIIRLYNLIIAEERLYDVTQIKDAIYNLDVIENVEITGKEEGEIIFISEYKGNVICDTFYKECYLYSNGLRELRGQDSYERAIKGITYTITNTSILIVDDPSQPRILYPMIKGIVFVN